MSEARNARAANKKPSILVGANWAALGQLAWIEARAWGRRRSTLLGAVAFVLIAACAAVAQGGSAIAARWLDREVGAREAVQIAAGVGGSLSAKLSDNLSRQWVDAMGGKEPTSAIEAGAASETRAFLDRMGKPKEIWVAGPVPQALLDDLRSRGVRLREATPEQASEENEARILSQTGAPEVLLRAQPAPEAPGGVGLSLDKLTVGGTIDSAWVEREIGIYRQDELLARLAKKGVTKNDLAMAPFSERMVSEPESASIEEDQKLLKDSPSLQAISEQLTQKQPGESDEERAERVRAALGKFRRITQAQARVMAADALARVALLATLGASALIGGCVGLGWWQRQEKGAHAPWAQSPCAGWAIAMAKPAGTAGLCAAILAAGTILGCLFLALAVPGAQTPWGALLWTPLGGALAAFTAAALEVAACLCLRRLWLKNLLIYPIAFASFTWPTRRVMFSGWTDIGGEGLYTASGSLRNALRVSDGAIAVAGPAPMAVKLGALALAIAVALAVACLAHWGAERACRRALQGE
jgi:hypothetical protein